MLHTITINLYNIDIEVHRYTWIFPFRIFRLALKITFSLNNFFLLQSRITGIIL